MPTLAKLRTELGHFSPVIRGRKKKSAMAICVAMLCAECLLPQPCCAQGQGTARSGSASVTNQIGAKLDVGPATPLPVKGIPQQFFAYSDPEDHSGKLLACAFVTDPEDARLSSSVYVSFDGGNSWMRTLLDAHSDWVSETSCAVGTEGRAYFVAGVSNTTAGALDHTTGFAELYRSSDAGLTWSEARRYPFIDWMQLAASGQGSAEKVYLFANMQAAGVGDAGQGVWIEKRRPMWKLQDGLQLSSPMFPEGVATGNKDHGYPVGAIVDGDKTIALFAEIPSRSFVLYQSDAVGYRLLSTIKLPAGTEAYGSLSAQLTFDSLRRIFYVAIPVLEQGNPALVLARSDDGALTWHSHVLIRESAPMRRDEKTYLYAGVAVNREGVLGLEWFPGEGCPVFAISSDAGASLSDSQPLGSCSGRRGSYADGFALDTNLKTYNDRSPIDHPLAYSRTAPPGFTVHASAGALGSVHIAADSEGRFHAFWTEPRWDGIRTFTSTVSVGRRERQTLRLSGLNETSGDSAVRVVRADFDPVDATFNMDISIRNIGSIASSYPLWLEAFADRSDCGAIQYLSASGVSESGHPVFKVPRRPDRQVLFPGEDSLVLHILLAVDGCRGGGISLTERARQNAMNLHSFFPLAVRFHVYSSQASGPE